MRGEEEVISMRIESFCDICHADCEGREIDKAICIAKRRGEGEVYMRTGKYCVNKATCEKESETVFMKFIKKNYGATVSFDCNKCKQYNKKELIR